MIISTLLAEAYVLFNPLKAMNIVSMLLHRSDVRGGRMALIPIHYSIHFAPTC
jgi:hypothetical protein